MPPNIAIFQYRHLHGDIESHLVVRTMYLQSTLYIHTLMKSLLMVSSPFLFRSVFQNLVKLSFCSDRQTDRRLLTYPQITVAITRQIVKQWKGAPGGICIHTFMLTTL